MHDSRRETVVHSECGEGEGGGEELRVGSRDKELIGVMTEQNAARFELDGMHAPMHSGILRQERACAYIDTLGSCADETKE